jgi:alpha-glucosidase
VVEKAARYHLIVDFHGAYKPTGLRRTFPNLITREGVLGLEYSKWSKRCSPDHEVLLPYTRMLAGPMDFTPGVFHVGGEDTFKSDAVPPMAQGTRAHQLAMYVVYESPLQMVADHPASLWGQQGSDFIKHVPTVWDETLFAGGIVGEYVVLARRSGEEWYVGCMTGWTERTVTVPLTFLGAGTYMAHLYSDDEERSDRVVVTMKEVTRRDSLEIIMASGGGCAIRIVPTWEQ